MLSPDKEAGLIAIPLPTPEKMAEYPCKWFIYMKTTEASQYFLIHTSKWPNISYKGGNRYFTL